MLNSLLFVCLYKRKFSLCDLYEMGEQVLYLH